MRTPGTSAETTRPRVMAAAVRLFAEKGYGATGIRDLAGQAGITPPALYHYVGTKDDLLVQIMRGITEPLIDAVEIAIGQHERAEAQLAAIVELHVWLHGSCPQATLIADTELRALDGDRRTEIIAMRDRYQKLWRNVVEAGTASEQFDVDDISVSAIALIELCTGVAHWYRPGGRMQLKELCETHADLALAMVRARRNRRPVGRSDLDLPSPGELLPLDSLDGALRG